MRARKSALDFEKLYTAADQYERIVKSLKEISTAEERMPLLIADPVNGAAELAAIAMFEAECLEQEAVGLEPLLGPEAAGRRIGLLRLVCALQHLARLGEERARAYFTFSRLGRAVPELFNEALEQTPENELFFLALRRFEAILAARSPWTIPDADWLRLRAATAPGRLRLRAAALRSQAQDASVMELSSELEAMRKPFLERGFNPAKALAWAVAGFTPMQAWAWRDEGIADPALAQAWRDRGLHSDESGAWASADFTPDEAAAFKACGAEDPATAISLRQNLGDVEHLLAWHRAGFAVAEVLRLNDSGVRTLADAVKSRQAEVFKAAAQASAEKAGPPPAVPGMLRPPDLRILRPGSPSQPNAGSANEGTAALGAGDTGYEPLRIIRSGDAAASTPPKIIRSTSLPLEEPTGASPVPASAAPPRISRNPAGGAPGADKQALGDTENWAQLRAERYFGVSTPDQAEALAAEPSNGGAWMGWGVFEPEPGIGGGAYDAHTLPLAGGLVDVVAESEGVALPERAHSPRALGAPLAWQQRLDRLRGIRGKGPLPGHWHLHAWPSTQAVLFWGFAQKTIAVPWGEAVDFDSHEAWQQRWARRAAEQGHNGLDCPCAIGKTIRGYWWVAILPSVTRVSAGVPQPIKLKAVEEEWRAQMEDFCIIMGMRPQGARWHLVAGQQDTI